MSNLWSQIKKAFQPSPDGIVTCTIGGWIGTVIWTAVLWKVNKPLEFTLGYFIGMAICMYIAMLIAFFKEKEQHIQQHEDVIWRLKTAESELDAARARQAFAEKLLKTSEEKADALEAQLGVIKRRRATRSRQFKHYGGVR